MTIGAQHIHRPGRRSCRAHERGERRPARQPAARHRRVRRCYEGRIHVLGDSGDPSGVVIAGNVIGPGGDSDGVQSSANGVQIVGNTFVGIEATGDRDIDALQLYGAGNTLIRGNYFHNVSSAIMSPDGGDHERIETTSSIPAATPTRSCWAATTGRSSATTRWPTWGGRAYSLPCGTLLINDGPGHRPGKAPRPRTTCSGPCRSPARARRHSWEQPRGGRWRRRERSRRPADLRRGGGPQLARRLPARRRFARDQGGDGRHRCRVLGSYPEERAAPGRWIDTWYSVGICASCGGCASASWPASRCRALRRALEHRPGRASSRPASRRASSRSPRRRRGYSWTRRSRRSSTSPSAPTTSGPTPTARCWSATSWPARRCAATSRAAPACRRRSCRSRARSRRTSRVRWSATAPSTPATCSTPDQYRLSIQSNRTVPVVDVYAEAPTAEPAQQLANGAVDGMKDYLRDLGTAQAIPENEQVHLQQLGGRRSPYRPGDQHQGRAAHLPPRLRRFEHLRSSPRLASARGWLSRPGARGRRWPRRRERLMEIVSILRRRGATGSSSPSASRSPSSWR